MFGFDNGYFLYMNEAEGTGDVNTRTARLNAIGAELINMGYKGKTVPHAVFLALLEKYNIKNITNEEIRGIEERWL